MKTVFINVQRWRQERDNVDPIYTLLAHPSLLFIAKVHDAELRAWNSPTLGYLRACVNIVWGLFQLVYAAHWLLGQLIAILNPCLIWPFLARTHYLLRFKMGCNNPPRDTPAWAGTPRNKSISTLGQQMPWVI